MLQEIGQRGPRAHAGLAPAPLLRSPRMRGLFVTFEGIDRSGKTTQAQLLERALGADALAVREPGGTEVGERVRDLVKDARLEPGPAGRGAAVRRRARRAGGRGHPAGARGRAGRDLRPLPRQLAGLPGERPRAGRGGGGAGQPLRDRRPGAGPDLPARARPGRRRRPRGHARPLRGRGARAPAHGGARPTTGWPTPTRGAGGASTARAPRTPIHDEVLAAVEAARSGARA